MPVDFIPNAVSSPLRGGNSGRASTHKGIENRVTDEAEHAHEPLGELEGVWRGMLFCRCSRDTSPDLLEPFLWFSVEITLSTFVEMSGER